MNAGGEPQTNPTTSSSTSITEHDYRFPRRPAEQYHDGSANDETSHNTSYNTTTTTTSTNAQDTGASALDKLDFSAENSARKELLRDSFFPTWKDDAAGEELDSPDEMQKKDPLATQIMEVIQQDQEAVAQPRADGESNLAHDGYEFAEAQATGGGCS